MKQFTGAITAIVTPFNQDGSVNADALQELVRFQLDGGIKGIVPCGSTGEAATLNDDEYQQVVKTVVEEVDGRIPVIAGAGSNDTQKAIRLSRLAKQAGADGLLHVTPYYNKPTPNGLVAHFKTIADVVDMPIILYNVPGRTGMNCPASLTLRVAQAVPQVVGVKEASGDVTQMMDLIKGRGNDLAILSGDDSLTLPLLGAGGDGCISVVANEIPSQFAQLAEAGLAGDFQTAQKIHYDYLDLMKVNFIETNPIPVKTALSMMGKLEAVFRLPLVSMEQQNKAVLKRTMEEVGLL